MNRLSPRLFVGCFGLVVAGCASLVVLPSGDSARGREVVGKWCAECHAIDGSAPPKSVAPLFADVADRPEHDQAWFRAFLDQDHFPMTTFRLLDQEKDDVAAFLASLRQ